MRRPGRPGIPFLQRSRLESDRVPRVDRPLHQRIEQGSAPSLRGHLKCDVGCPVSKEPAGAMRRSRPPQRKISDEKERPRRDDAEIDASDDKVVSRSGGGDAQRFQDFSVDRADLTARNARAPPHLLAVVIPENPYPRNHNDLVNDPVLSRTGGDDQTLHRAVLSKGSPLQPVEHRRHDASGRAIARRHEGHRDSRWSNAKRMRLSISLARPIFTGWYPSPARGGRPGLTWRARVPTPSPARIRGTLAL